MLTRFIILYKITKKHSTNLPRFEHKRKFSGDFLDISKVFKCKTTENTMIDSGVDEILDKSDND